MTLGVIGGLGPIATAYFMELIIKMTDARCDQDHLDMIIYSSPGIPDRTSYILGKSDQSPLEPMIEIGRKLSDQGVNCISIPCITAHYFHEQLTESIPVPIIHAISETAHEIYAHGLKKVGIMATDGTVRSRIFQTQLEALGMEVVLPDETHQQYVMDIIYQNVKAGVPVEMEKFHMVSDYLHKEGAQIIILGCTELSLVKRDYAIGKGYIDAMEVLAQRSIVRCGGKLKDAYQSLITG